MLFFILLSAFVLEPFASAGTNDSLALLDLKQHVSDPLGTLVSWNKSANLCSDWKGVVCEATQQRVNSLQLHSLSSLSSSLLATITETLSELEELSVRQSTFTDPIDRFNPGSCSLKVIDISNNRLNGSFPDGLIHRCMRVRLLNLSHNRLEGELGDVFSKLETVDVNFTSGSLSLEVLDASFNNFTGELPALHGMRELKYLDLSSNMFTTSPATLCSNGLKLDSLILANNRLGGDLLTSILNCSLIATLDLSFNSLTGELPNNLCVCLPNLHSLLLTLNRLQGWIPSGLSYCSKLTILLLGFNNLQGVIPSELSQLSNLWWLDLNNNNLSGKIPTSFGLLQNMVVLLLSGNYLHGEIPRELAGCRNLLVLEVGSNKLTGGIPSHIGRRQLGNASVNMDDYQVVGSIGNLRIIQTIRVRTCELRGIARFFLAQGITAEELQERVRERNGCSGINLAVVPSFSFNVRTVILLDLSHNKLTGSIPPELGEMESLFVFHASHNLLSGTLPPQLRKLRQLLEFDVSYNILHGQIPATIGELTFVTVLNFSYNNLSGPIPQIGQLTAFDSTSYIGNPGLCGQPVSPDCRNDTTTYTGSTPNPSSNSAINVESNVDVLAIGFVFGLLGFLGCGTLVFIKSRDLVVKLGLLLEKETINEHL